jgi:hypothetical protein
MLWEVTLSKKIEGHAYCAKPECACEIFEEEDYVHFQGEFWHVNCWWTSLSLPPAYISDAQAAAIYGPIVQRPMTEHDREETAQDRAWEDGRVRSIYKE